MATSTAVKQRYKDKTYKRWFCDLKNSDFDELEAVRAETGLSRAEFLKKLVAKEYGLSFDKE